LEIPVQQEDCVTVRRLREAINETQDRWETAATSLETCIASPRPVIFRRLDVQRQNAVRMAGRLKEVLESTCELAFEARAKIIGDIDQLTEQIEQGRVENRTAALEQKRRIEPLKQSLEARLDRVSGDVHPDLEQAVRGWLRAQIELETGLELAAQRFAYERNESQAWFEMHKQEMLRKIEQFRAMLNERCLSATRRGRPFGPEMNAAYDRICTSFGNLANSSSAHE
jgi:hypothetical protein